MITRAGTDTDVDNTTASLVVASFRTGATEGAGTAGTLGSGLVGAHGTLTLNSDGSYSYVVNEADATVQLLNVGGTITDSFNYTVSPGGLTDTAVLTITIHGADDAPVGGRHQAAGCDCGTEKGGTANGTGGSNATGNVITNDTDVDKRQPDGQRDPHRRHRRRRHGRHARASALVGAHGTLTLNANGSYTYVVNENDATVQALNTGGTTTDSFNYTVSDGSLTDTAVLTSPSTAPTTRRWGGRHQASAGATAATEKGGTANGSGGNNATGNVITNDTDVDSGMPDGQCDPHRRHRRRRHGRHARRAAWSARTARSRSTPTAATAMWSTRTTPRCRRSTSAGRPPTASTTRSATAA